MRINGKFSRVLLFCCLLFLILFLSVPARAQENRGGFGAYAVFHKNWNCDAMMAVYEGVPSLRMSALWNTFGKKFDCLNRWAADPRPKHLEVHLINEVCQRNGRCDKNEFLYGIGVDEYRRRLEKKDQALLTAAQNYSKPIADWFSSHPDVACSYSPGLESNLPKEAFKTLAEALKPIFPARCKAVYNPVNNNKFGSGALAGYVHELHSPTAKLKAPCRNNLDGYDVDLKARRAILAQFIKASELPSFIRSYSSCDSADIWVAESNGLEGGSFVFPLRRSKFLTMAIAKEINGYLRAKPVVVPPWTAADDAAKKGCKEYLKINDGAKKDFLWKQSEPECCGRGAVVFLPEKYKELKIDTKKVFVMRRNKVIASAYERSVYTEDNKNRQIWRFRKVARDFPFNVVAHVGRFCAVLPNPKERND